VKGRGEEEKSIIIKETGRPSDPCRCVDRVNPRMYEEESEATLSQQNQGAYPYARPLLTKNIKKREMVQEAIK
jgi:hypothetical protein